MTVSFCGPGATFDTVVAGSNASGSVVGGAISRSSSHNCVFVDQSSSSNPAVQLPSGCEDGDIFEIYIDSGSAKALAIYAPSGDTFGGAVDPVNGNVVSLSGSLSPPGGVGIFIRKLPSGFWGNL